MAHNHDNFLSSHYPEYHPLDNIQSTYHLGTETVQSGTPYTSRGHGKDATSYSGHDITDYRDNQSAPSLAASDPKDAYYRSGSPAQKLHPTEIITNPLSARPSFRFRDWQWEFGASMFSLGCFAAVVGVLATNEDKSLASWSFVFGISLNTLIAILSTLSRTALMVPVASCISQLKWIHLVTGPRALRDVQVFEDASRGPWGSLELISRLHIKAKLATWGSLITILTLAMGPFAQQLLSYPSRILLDGDATFYTSHIYDSAYGESRTYRAQTGQITATMGPKMQGAILNGLFDLSAPIMYTCSTGNCQWDDFSSLAVTSSCQNVTSNTNVSCGTSAGSRTCNYTTPAGFLIQSRSSSRSGGGFSTNFNSTAFMPDSYDMSVMDPREELINSTIARVAMANLQGDFNMTRPEVLECDMRLCARVTRNLTITNGTFNAGDSEMIELEGVAGRYEESLKPGVRSNRDWYTFNITGDHPSYPGNRSFSYNMVDIEGVKGFLYDIFTSNAGTAGSGGMSPYYWPLMNSSDKAGTVAAISNSMSYAFAHAPSGQELKGRALSEEIYIRVHWYWVILPLTEVVMGIAFLMCTLLHTHRKGVAVWKTSGIVPLLTVMVGWDNSDLGAASWKEIQQRSKDMRGQLVTNDGDVQGFHRVG